MTITGFAVSISNKYRCRKAGIYVKYCKRRNRLFAVLLITTLLLSTISPTVSATGFADINAAYPYLDAVNYVSDNGFMVGTSNSYFSPNNSLTRAMAVAVLYRKAGSPYVSGNSGFTDVPSTAYYANAVVWAKNHNIVSGTSATKFSPDVNVTRQDAMCFLYRYSKIAITADIPAKAGSVISGYSDYSSVSQYAREAMAWAVGNKILDPVSGKLSPKSVITRVLMANAITKFGTNVERLENARDYFSFYNEGIDEDAGTPQTSKYFSKKMYMTNNHKNKWFDALKKKYTPGSANYSTAVEGFNELWNNVPSGRCFGMSAACVLDKYGKIAFNENFSSGSSSTIKSVACSPGSQVESAITYYHMTQNVPSIYVKDKTDIGNTLNKMKNSTGPSLLAYTAITPEGYIPPYGHAVVVNSCTYDGSRYILKLYDSNMAKKTTWTVYAKSGTYYISSSDNYNGDHFVSAYAITDFDVFEPWDIDGKQNAKSTALSSSYQLNSTEYLLRTETAEEVDLEKVSTIYFKLQDGVKITNERGEALIWEKENFSGDMKIYRWNFIAGTSPVVVWCDVPVSTTFQMESTGEDKQIFAVIDKYRYQCVKDFSGIAALHSDGSMELSGNLDFFKAQCFRPGDSGTQSLYGTGSQSVSIAFTDHELRAVGMVGTYTLEQTDSAGTDQITEVEVTVEEEAPSFTPCPAESSQTEVVQP